MRCVIFSALLAMMSTGANAQAFGVGMGDPVSRHNGTGKDGIDFRVTVPQPNSEFDFYSARATPVTGICRVVGFGNDHKNDAYGTSVRGAYKSLQSALNAKYGNNKSFDFLRTDALWNEDKEFVWSIFKNERTMSTFWDRGEGSQLPPNVRAINLRIVAVNSSAAYIVLSYEFDNYDKCEELSDKKDNAGL